MSEGTHVRACPGRKGKSVRPQCIVSEKVLAVKDDDYN